MTRSTLPRIGSHKLVEGTGRWLEALESRVLLSGGFLPADTPLPDLAMSIQRFTAPQPVVPGDKLSLTVQVTNLSGPKAAGAVDVELFLSRDGVVDEQDDLVWQSLDRPINLAAGKNLAIPVKLATQEMPDPGAWRLLARVSGISDANPANNVAAGDPFDVVWQFGQVGQRRNVKLIARDPDGTLVTLQIKGPGTGQIVPSDGPPDLTLSNTTLQSQFTATTKGGDGLGQIDDILAFSPIGKIVAPGVDLLGGGTFSGGLLSLSLHDVREFAEVDPEGAMIDVVDQTHHITVGGNDGGALDIKLNRVADTSIHAQRPIKGLTVLDWQDRGTGNDEVVAPSVAAITVKGAARSQIAGDFAADVRLAGASAGLTLGKLTVAGSVLGELFIEGDVGSIQAGQIRNQVNILGKAKTVTVKNSTMTLSEVGSTYGSLRIQGGGKLRTADEQVTLEDERVYLGGRQTYDLDQLMNYDHPGDRWTYQTRVRNAVSFDGPLTQTVSNQTPVINGHEALLVEEESQYTSGSFAWTMLDGIYLLQRQLVDEESTMTFTFSMLRVAAEDMPMRQAMTDESALEMLISVPSVPLEGQLQGTASISTTLLGHETVTLPSGRLLAAKLSFQLNMTASGEVTSEGMSANLTLTAKDTITLWAVPGLGVIRWEETFPVKGKVAGGPSGTLGYTETRILTDVSLQDA